MEHNSLLAKQQDVRNTLLELRDTRRKLEALHKEVQTKYNAFLADIKKCNDFITALKKKDIIDLSAILKVRALIKTKEVEIEPTLLELAKIEETLGENHELRKQLIETGMEIKKQLKKFGLLIPFPLRAPEEASEPSVESSDRTS